MSTRRISAAIYYQSLQSVFNRLSLEWAGITLELFNKFVNPYFKPPTPPPQKALRFITYRTLTSAALPAGLNFVSGLFF